VLSRINSRAAFAAVLALVLCAIMLAAYALSPLPLAGTVRETRSPVPLAGEAGAREHAGWK